MSTGEFIAFHAAERPNAVAIVDRGREITYDQFHRDLGRFVHAVADLGLRRGSSVTVAWGELYPHWLLLVACEWLGIATATFLEREDDGASRLLETADLVISHSRPPWLESTRHQLLAEPWLRGIFDRADLGLPAAPPEKSDDPLRLIRTSGTTGVPKRMLLTRHRFEAIVGRWAWSMGITRSSSSLVNTAFTAMGSYALATAVLRAGGTMIHPRPEIGTAAALLGPARSITLLRAIPQELKLVLESLPANFAKPATLTVVAVGAPLAASLRETALKRLASEIVVSYACNEMPFVAMTRGSSEGAKTVYPWVDVEIVDERDVPLPFGAIGRIRLRDDAMATGYLDEPETTALKFRDGWFYPGDTGILRGPGRLEVIGREDDVLNIGGMKVASNTLEALVQHHATVGDVGVCAFANSDGIAEVCVAVADAAHDDAALIARIAEAFRKYYMGRFFVVRLAEIPRNANGKIERKRLKEIAAAALSQTRQPGA